MDERLRTARRGNKLYGERGRDYSRTPYRVSSVEPATTNVKHKHRSGNKDKAAGGIYLAYPYLMVRTTIGQTRGYSRKNALVAMNSQTRRQGTGAAVSDNEESRQDTGAEPMSEQRQDEPRSDDIGQTREDGR